MIIGIWGQLGGEVVADGQAIRTRYLISELSKKYGSDSLKVCNTQGWKKRPIRFFFSSIILFFKSDMLIILPANNGLKVISSLYNFLLKIKTKDIYYFVIGGFLDKFLDRYPKYQSYLKKYKGYFVQTNTLKNQLMKRNFDNVFVIPNFKELPEIKITELMSVKFERPFMFSILSRITEEKGITIAIEAIDKINLINPGVCKLDIYGIIDPKYKQKFFSLIENNKYITYKSVIPFDKTNIVLKKYHALIFPTFYPGEGFAGCLVDAFAAGLPILASRWMANPEIVIDGENGLLFQPRNVDVLTETLLSFMADEDRYFKIRLNNLLKSKDFTAEKMLLPFFNHIEKTSLRRFLS